MPGEDPPPRAFDRFEEEGAEGPSPGPQTPPSGPEDPEESSEAAAVPAVPTALLPHSVEGVEGCCCICLEDLETPGLGTQVLQCAHVLHERCVTELRRLGASGCCPLCREAHADLTPVQVLVDRAAAALCRRAFDEGVRVLREALDLSPRHAKATCLLGECHFEGRGVPRDLHRARELLEDALRAGQVRAANSLGLLCWEQGRFEEARLELVYRHSHSASCSVTRVRPEGCPLRPRPVLRPVHCPFG